MPCLSILFFVSIIAQYYLRGKQERTRKKLEVFLQLELLYIYVHIFVGNMTNYLIMKVPEYVDIGKYALNLYHLKINMTSFNHIYKYLHSTVHNKEGYYNI